MIAQALALLLLLPTVTAARAQVPADEARREAAAQACQADVHRLCETFFPDERLVATCLVDRRADLSPACAEVLAHPPGDDEAEAPPTPGSGTARR